MRVIIRIGNGYVIREKGVVVCAANGLNAEVWHPEFNYDRNWRKRGIARLS